MFAVSVLCHCGFQTCVRVCVCVAPELVSVAYTAGDAVEDRMSRNITSLLISLNLFPSSWGSVGGFNEGRKCHLKPWRRPRLGNDDSGSSDPKKTELLTSHSHSVLSVIQFLTAALFTRKERNQPNQREMGERTLEKNIYLNIFI